MGLINEDYILLILNCEKYKYKALKQKQSWLLNFTLMPYFHVIGNPNLPTEYKIDEQEKILYVNTPDDYISLPKKVIAAYKAISKEYFFKYIFKTDDDQLLCKNTFLQTLSILLNNKIPMVHYGGYIVNVDKPYLSQYHSIHTDLPKHLPILCTKYCSGRFYLLSNEAVKDLICKTSFIEKEYLEDYAIGYHLDKSFKQSILHIQTNKYFTDLW
jgi:hypothetical protein